MSDTDTTSLSQSATTDTENTENKAQAAQDAGQKAVDQNTSADEPQQDKQDQKPAEKADAAQQPAPAAAASPAPAPKPVAPSPATLAKKKPAAAAPSPVTYTAKDISEAASHAILRDGTILVKDGETEREVGTYAQGESDAAVDLLVRRYLDLRARVDMFAGRLHSRNIRTHEIDETLASLDKDLKEPKAVGDLPALRAHLDEVRGQADKKKAQIEQWHQKAVEKSLKDRTAVVEQAETIVASLGDQTNWRDTADKFRDLFTQWQSVQRKEARLDRKTADELWKRFSQARSTFNHRRRAWAKQRDAERDQAKAAKEQIISEAEAMEHSTDWGETSRAYNELMDRWKAAGRAGRRDDDALWARFRAACDVFFNARQADRDKTDKSEEDNLAKKRELLDKACKLVPVTTLQEARQARQALGAIQDEWDQIGYVPRRNIHELEQGMADVEQQIKAVEDAAWKASDPEEDERKNSFESQLTSRLAEIDKLLATESDPKKKEALEQEKATKQMWLSTVKKTN